LNAHRLAAFRHTHQRVLDAMTDEPGSLLEIVGHALGFEAIHHGDEAENDGRERGKKHQQKATREPHRSKNLLAESARCDVMHTAGQA
jgi:hypothetical protein